jgi:biopolymer transport protein ExbD
MARNFRRHRAAHPIADLNVTNLIDLGFILLVIFMIATPLMQQQQTMQVNLPTVPAAPQPPESKDRFVLVGVNARGFFVENRTAPLSLAELRERLRAYAAEAKPPVIRIHGDAAVPYQKVAELFTEVQKAGLSRFNFDTQAQPSGR